MLLIVLTAATWLTPLPAHPARSSCYTIGVSSVTARMSAATTSWGRDPRAGNSAIVADEEWAAERLIPGEVCELTSVGQLQAAFDRAAETGARLVVLKFERENCAACKRTHDLYHEAASKLKGKALCFTVDCYKCQSFAKSAGIRAVPTAHVYCDATLDVTTRLSRNEWPAFYKRLRALSSAAGEQEDGHGHRRRRVLTFISKFWRRGRSGSQTVVDD